MNTPEEIVLSCARYFRTNEGCLYANEKTIREEDNKQPLSSSFTSVLTLGYNRLATLQKDRTFTIDLVKLSIIIAKFEECSLLINGIPQLTPVSPAQSIRTVSSLTSLASSISTLSFLGWRKTEKTELDARLHFQNELEYVYHSFQKIQRLRINFLNISSNLQHDLVAMPVSLRVFRNLTYLDLQKLPPRYFTNWDILRQNLESFVCHGGIVDLYDLFIDTIARDISVGIDITRSKLHSIDLSHNDLANLAVEPILSVTACESLNLSYNLLLSVPLALTELFRLKDLNLSHNMISNLTGIDRILGNITTLDLSYNKLKNLCGLRKLWALTVINISGNEISDIGEVGRLVELPSIQEVYIKANPLTQKTGYRSRIFFIFISHGLDILLDGTGPSFLEKRNIITEPQIAGADATVGPMLDSVSENVASTLIPTLKVRRSHHTALKNRRKGRRVVDINSDEISTSSILESDEPDELTGEDIPHQPASRFLTNSKPVFYRTNSPSSPSASSSTCKRLFVHRLVELEKTLQAGYRDYPTRGRYIHRDGQSFSLRSRSPASVHSSIPVTATTNSNEDYRKKIEALRSEAGPTWLKVYSELQHPKRPIRKENSGDNQDFMEDKFIVGSSPSTLALVSAHKPALNINEYINRNNESMEDSSRSLASTNQKKSTHVVENSISTQPKPSTKLIKPEEVNPKPSFVPEVETNKPPEGKQYKIQVIEYSSRIKSKRFIRVPSRERTLVITNTAFVELDPETFDILCQRGFQGLLRVETKRVGKLTQHVVFRLEFKYRRYDNPTFCDYYFLDDHSDAKTEKELQTKFENIVRSNWEEGKGYEVYKQGKCLNCSWVGFLDLEDSRENRNLDGFQRLNVALSPATSESKSDIKEKERKCPVCSGTFLVEFFRHEENEISRFDEVPTWAFTSSSDIASSGSSANTKHGFFNSWLGNSLGGLAKRNDIKCLENHDQVSLVTIQEVKPVILEMEILKKMERVVGYSASLPPYRSLTNAIRLFLQLTIIEDEEEKINSWIPSSYILHAPTSIQLPSMWSMMTSSAEVVPKNAPPEKPSYITLTSKSIYLLTPQNIPLPGSTSTIENNPSKYLKLLYTIPIPLIARIDVGPSSQTLTIHLNLVSSDGSIIQPTDSPSALPPHSVTFLMRDKSLCSSFLNALAEICYDHEEKMVNHDIEWAIRNIRRQVLIDEINPTLLEVPNHHLIGIDPASDSQVVVDKTTFDFLKFYLLVTRLMEPSSAPATAIDSLSYDVEAFTMIGTERYIYLCKERHDVWPPAVTNMSEVPNMNPSSVRKAEGIWGRRKDPSLIATLVKQYERVEVAPISWITQIEKVRKGMNMIIGKEKEGASIGCTVTGWEVLVRITFYEDKPQLNLISDSFFESTGVQDSVATIERIGDVESVNGHIIQESGNLPFDNNHEKPVVESSPLETNRSGKQMKKSAHFTWCVLFSTEMAADEFTKNIRDVGREIKLK